jgi:hypothetical protein
VRVCVWVRTCVCVRRTCVCVRVWLRMCVRVVGCTPCSEKGSVLPSASRLYAATTFVGSNCFVSFSSSVSLEVSAACCPQRANYWRGQKARTARTGQKARTAYWSKSAYCTLVKKRVLRTGQQPGPRAPKGHHHLTAYWSKDYHHLTAYCVLVNNSQGRVLYCVDQ